MTLREKLRELYYVTGYTIVGFIMCALGYKEMKCWNEIPDDVTKLTEWKFHLEFIR